jgi:hypothetical protein
MTDDLLKRAREAYVRWNNPPSADGLPGGAGVLWDAAGRIEDQAALIKELVEELDAVRIIAAQAHRNYGNIGKETTFLLIIEERAAAALAKAKAVQPKIDLAGIHGQHENLGDF